jgi:large subunit ribosomal protein L28
LGRCELTGKSPVVKNLVSHSNIKTKSISQPNIQKKRVFSNALGRLVTLRMAASTLRDMEHIGGFDKFVLNQADDLLSKRALAVKMSIRLKMSGGKKSKGAATAAPVEAAAKKAKPAAKKTAAKPKTKTAKA